MSQRDSHGGETGRAVHASCAGGRPTSPRWVHRSSTTGSRGPCRPGKHGSSRAMNRVHACCCSLHEDRVSKTDRLTDPKANKICDRHCNASQCRATKALAYPHHRPGVSLLSTHPAIHISISEKAAHQVAHTATTTTAAATVHLGPWQPSPNNPRNKAALHTCIHLHSYKRKIAYSMMSLHRRIYLESSPPILPPCSSHDCKVYSQKHREPQHKCVMQATGKHRHKIPAQM